MYSARAMVAAAGPAIRSAVLVLLFPLCGWAGPALQAVVTSPTEAARMAVLARLEALRAIEVDYEVEESFTPERIRPLQNSLRGPVKLKVGTERSTDRFCFLDGMARWVIRRSKETIEADRRNNIIPVVQIVQTYSRGTFERLNVRVDKALGAIEEHSQPPAFPAVDVGLGLRDGENGNWLSAAALEAMEASHDPAGRFVLRREIAGGQILEWVFDPAHAYALVSHRRVIIGPPQIIAIDFSASEFRHVDGIPMPFLIVRRNLYRNGEEVARWSARIKRYVLNGSGNTPDLYRLRWPQGVKLMDRRTGNEFRVNVDRQVLDPATLSAGTHVPSSDVVENSPVRLLRSQTMQAPQHAAPAMAWPIRLGIILATIAMIGLALFAIRNWGGRWRGGVNLKRSSR